MYAAATLAKRGVDVTLVDRQEELGGTVICAYYAENLEDGRVVVFNSNALEPDNATVSGIVQLMVDTFKIV